jgi:hypothetical protein
MAQSRRPRRLPGGAPSNARRTHFVYSWWRIHNAYRSRLERNEIIFTTVMVAQELGHFRFPNPIQRAGSGIGKSPSFCSIGTILPSRPVHSQCRRAQRRSGWARLRGHRAAARSVLDGREHGGTLGRVGDRSTSFRPSRSAREAPSKTEITLSELALIAPMRGRGKL